MTCLTMSKLSFSIVFLALMAFSAIILPSHTSNRILRGCVRAQVDQTEVDDSKNSTESAEDLSLQDTYHLCGDPEFEYSYANGSCISTCDTSSHRFIRNIVHIMDFKQKICETCDLSCATCSVYRYHCISCAPGYKVLSNSYPSLCLPRRDSPPEDVDSTNMGPSHDEKNVSAKGKSRTNNSHKKFGSSSKSARRCKH